MTATKSHIHLFIPCSKRGSESQQGTWDVAKHGKVTHEK